MIYSATMQDVQKAIKVLHARKDRAYGGAWKRRGERISVVPNIARKVDRLTTFADDELILPDEHILDTAVDLYVYVLKYRLFLAEQAPSLVAILGLREPSLPLSDGNDNFNQLVDGGKYEFAEKETAREMINCISSLFEQLWPAVEAESDIEQRLSLANKLGEAAKSLVVKIGCDYPVALEQFVRNELARPEASELRV
jgi:hypothetical protein